MVSLRYTVDQNHCMLTKYNGHEVHCTTPVDSSSSPYSIQSNEFILYIHNIYIHILYSLESLVHEVNMMSIVLIIDLLTKVTSL